MTFVYLLIGILVVLGFWVVATYNFFVSSKARIKASIQEIGNQLKRQVDLIPNLESSAKGYLKHETGIYEKITEARKAIAGAIESGDLQKMADAGDKFASILPSIKIAVESNPELKADSIVGKLMDELRDTSDKIMYARRLLIDLTADFNVKRVAFPSNLIAGAFRFEEMQGIKTPQEGGHIEVDESDLETPKVNI